MKTSSQQQAAELEQFMQHVRQNKASGDSYANCSPSLNQRNNFKANEHFFGGTSDAPNSVLAFERFRLDGYDEMLGAFFRLGIGGDGQLRVLSAMGNVDHGLYEGRDLAVDALVWRPGEQLSFNFSFTFKFSGVEYRLDAGYFMLRF